ncbi:MAG: hypothetical protein H6563_10330 [Lewinellaceae bacterium]|nr:hypothetical protein [Lewinellaceae bacterium]
MRKEKFLVALAGIAFLLLFGVVNSHAQISTTPNAGSTPYKSLDALDPAYNVSGTNFVTPNEALAILKAKYELQNVDPNGMSESEEANQGVRLAYYPHLATLIQSTNDVNYALPASAIYLEKLILQHKAGIGLNAQAIYQETVNFLTN